MEYYITIDIDNIIINKIYHRYGVVFGNIQKDISYGLCRTEKGLVFLETLVFPIVKGSPKLWIKSTRKEALAAIIKFIS